VDVPSWVSLKQCRIGASRAAGTIDVIRDKRLGSSRHGLGSHGQRFPPAELSRFDLGRLLGGRL